MAWDQTYRPLEKDEIILATDEVYDDGKREWIVTPNCVGKPAPDRLYTSHRTYRRLRTYDELMAYYRELELLIEAGPTEFSGDDYMKFLHDTVTDVARVLIEMRQQGEQYEWDEIPDTPEQRALIAAHNADIRERYPNMVDINTGETIS